jgi:hypothetical protein
MNTGISQPASHLNNFRGLLSLSLYLSVGAPIITKTAIIAAKGADINETAQKDPLTKMPVTQFSGSLENGINLTGLPLLKQKGNVFFFKYFFPVGLSQNISQLM